MVVTFVSTANLTAKNAVGRQSISTISFVCFVFNRNTPNGGKTGISKFHEKTFNASKIPRWKTFVYHVLGMLRGIYGDTIYCVGRVTRGIETITRIVTQPFRQNTSCSDTSDVKSYTFIYRTVVAGRLACVIVRIMKLCPRNRYEIRVCIYI